MRAAETLDPTLRDIVAAARERLAPTRIILFGSRARGDARPDSDYDVLVETALRPTRAESWDAVEEVRVARRIAIDLHVRAPGDLERRAPDPGWIDGEIVRDGILLYCAPVPAPAPAPDTAAAADVPPRVREPSPSGPPGEWPSVAAWLEKADRDMQHAELAMAQPNPFWEIIAFHAQQAAEKTMKAGLVMRGRRPPRTHKLSELFAELSATGVVLPDLTHDCKALERYAIDGRYPSDVAIPTDAEGRALVESARRIISAVRALRS